MRDAPYRLGAPGGTGAPEAGAGGVAEGAAVPRGTAPSKEPPHFAQVSAVPGLMELHAGQRTGFVAFFTSLMGFAPAKEAPHFSQLPVSGDVIAPHAGHLTGMFA